MNIRCNLKFMFCNDRGIDFSVAPITYSRRMKDHYFTVINI